MRFDREMDSKPARQSSLPSRRSVHFAVHLMAISNITRLDTGEVTHRPDRVGTTADHASPVTDVGCGSRIRRICSSEKPHFRNVQSSAPSNLTSSGRRSSLIVFRPPSAKKWPRGRWPERRAVDDVRSGPRLENAATNFHTEAPTPGRWRGLIWPHHCLCSRQR